MKYETVYIIVDWKTGNKTEVTEAEAIEFYNKDKAKFDFVADSNNFDEYMRNTNGEIYIQKYYRFDINGETRMSNAIKHSDIDEAYAYEKQNIEDINDYADFIVDRSGNTIVPF